MKNLSIYLTILFSIILFTFSSDNVKALTRANITSDFVENNMIIDYNSIASFSNVSSSVLSNFDTKLHQTIDTDNFYYIVYLTHYSNENYLNILYFAKNQNVIPYLNFYHSVYSGYHCLNIAWYYSSAFNFGTYWYDLSSSNSTYKLTADKSYSSRTMNFQFGRIFSNNGVDYNQVGLSHSSFSTYLYDTNVPIKYISTNNGSENIDNFYIVNSSDNTNYLILNGDIFLDSNLQMPFLMPTPPSFLFLVNDNRDEFNRLISVDIRLNVDNYSDDFVIQYITGDTSGTWTTIALEYNELTGYYFTWNDWSYNTTIFVRAIYLGNHEVVSSASQEISGIIPSYDSGQVNNFGNNSFGITSNQVTITGENLFNNITCSSQRAFVDNVCYVNDSDILDIQDKLNNKVHVRFNFSMHNINVPYQGGKYYLFSYRSYFDTILLPFNVSIVSGNSVNSTATIIDYNVKEHGLYRDYIILFSSDSSQSLLAVDGVNLDFPVFSTIFDSFPQPFTLGFYNGVKYQQFDTLPTLSDIDNFYNNNTLDSLNNDSLLSFFSKFSVNDHGLSSVVLKPIDFLNHLTNSTCSPVQFPLPHTDKILTLPCIRPLFELHLPSVFQLYQLIVSGLIFYRIGIDLFRLIKNLFNPENDKIEVVDL